jgi:phthiocerol/phenolphthiocerol synthesis type-I polyketide synthase E
MTGPAETERFAVAIIGMAGRFPGAPSLEQYWDLLARGQEGIRRFTEEELLSRGVPAAHIADPAFVPVGAPIEGADLFAASFFGYSPREASLIDPQQRLFLECSWQALEDAGYGSSERRTNIGVFAGGSLSSYLLFNLLSNKNVNQAEDEFQVMIGTDKDFLSSRVSYKLNLKGPSLTVQTGCSSSLVAVHLAVRSLLSYQCDVALAGGVSIGVPQRTGYRYQPGGILSPDGRCRAFDADAAGTIFGEGVGIVVLKRLDDAIRDQDNVHAIVLGSSINNDGASKVGYTAPSVEGQTDVIATAHAVAGISADTITYVESHGTATTLGDPVEVAALTKAFRLSTPRRNFCGLGSVKTNIGHLDAAAGIAGLLKAVLMLKHRSLVPSLHFQSPNPQIDFSSSPFYVVSGCGDWHADGVRRAGVSSFGIGGTNAHVVLEEAPEVPSVVNGPTHNILTLSAQTGDDLGRSVLELSSFLSNVEDNDIADVAHTLQVGREHFSHRCAVVCNSRMQAIEAMCSMDGESAYRGSIDGPSRGAGFLFPGGGTQYPGMAREIYLSEPRFRGTMDYCCSLLKQHTGYDLRLLLYPNTDEVSLAASKLAQPDLGLPAIFATQYSLATLLQHWGLSPACMLGHSLGEYAAACVSGVFKLEDTLALVSLRGRLLASLSQGAMVSVYLSENRAYDLLSRRCSIAAVNSSNQCVVSGPADEIEHLCVQLSRSSIEFRKLHVGAGAHSSMVEPVLEEFGSFISSLQLNPPSIPFISNVSGTWITGAEARSAHYWVEHLRKTVRFADGLRELLRDDRLFLVEVGPSHTLTSLARAEAKQRSSLFQSCLPHPNDHGSDLQLLYRTLARMWAAGVNVKWSRIHATPRRFLSLPTYPFDRRRYWLDPVPTKSGLDQGESIPNGETEPAIYSPGWRQSPLSFTGGISALESSVAWIILLDESGVGRTLVELLSKEGYEICQARQALQAGPGARQVYLISDETREEVTPFVKGLALPEKCEIRVIYLRPLTIGRMEFPPSFEDVLERVVELVELTKTLGEFKGQPRIRLLVLSRGAAQVSGSDRSSPDMSPLVAACRVIPQEHTNIDVRLVDVSCDDLASPAASSQIAAQIVAEASRNQSDLLVSYRGNRRWVEQYLPVPAAPFSPLREGGVYLFLGGLGDLGRSIIRFVAEHVACRIVVVGRSEFPEREKWDDWLRSHFADDPISQRISFFYEIEARGSSVCVLLADVADRTQMQAVFHQIDAVYGSLDGVFHLAGVTGARALCLIDDLDAAECRRQLEAKVHGTILLSEFLRRRKLDFCILFSSTASILGGPGLMAYGAANAFIDAFALTHTQHYNQRWIAINWDGWITGQASSGSARRVAALDDYALPSETALRFLSSLLNTVPGGQYAVCRGNLEERRTAVHKSSKIDDQTSREHLASSYIAGNTDMERHLAAIWSEVLGHTQVGIHDNFFELGGNSLLGLRIMSRLQKDLKVTLSVISLFEAPTVHSLAQLAERHNAPVDYAASRRRGALRRNRRSVVRQ